MNGMSAQSMKALYDEDPAAYGEQIIAHTPPLLIHSMHIRAGKCRTDQSQSRIDHGPMCDGTRSYK